MDSGLAALLGAFVGGGLTAGSNVWLESTRNKNAETDRKARAASEGRQARRLISGELKRCFAGLVAAKEDGKDWDVAPEVLLPADEWTTYRHVLAIHLDDTPWLACVEAYTKLQVIRDSEPSAATGELGDLGLEAVVKAMRALDEADG